MQSEATRLVHSLYQASPEIYSTTIPVSWARTIVMLSTIVSKKQPFKVEVSSLLLEHARECQLQ